MRVIYELVEFSRSRGRWKGGEKRSKRREEKKESEVRTRVEKAREKRDESWATAYTRLFTLYSFAGFAGKSAFQYKEEAGVQAFIQEFSYGGGQTDKKILQGGSIICVLGTHN